MTLRWPAFATVFLIVALFSVASYPGFMSFDSLEALRQARGTVEGSQYPPFGSYVWRLFDWLWPGPTLMQIFQNGMLMLSLAFIAQRLRWPVLVQVVALGLFALAPPITGTMMVVWKDVAVAAFYIASFTILLASSMREPGKRGGMLALAIVVAFCGMAYRFNAASGAYPLFVYAFWLGLGGRWIAGGWGRCLLAGAALVLTLFAGVWCINSYRFPTFERLERNTNVEGIMRYDLIGISRYAGHSLLVDKNGKQIDAAYLAGMYDPRHLNLTGLNDKEKRLSGGPTVSMSQWAQAIADYPLAYVKHRLAIAREFISLHRHEVFYVTHPSVDENPFGITHTPNALTAVAVSYVWERRASWYERPWVYYAAALIALAAMRVFRASTYRVEAVVIMSSGLLYLIPMCLITPAADLRYNFWSICAALTSLAFSVTGLLSAVWRRPAGPGSRVSHA